MADGPNRRALVFGALCSLVGLFFGALVFWMAEGEGYEGFAAAAPAAAFLCGAALWRLLPERVTRRRRVWGAVAGALAGVASHYVTWYLQYLGANVCHWLTGGCTSSLGEPPANLLAALWGAAAFTYFSLLTVGWLTFGIGAGLGLAFAWARPAD